MRSTVEPPVWQPIDTIPDNGWFMVSSPTELDWFIVHLRAEMDDEKRAHLLRDMTRWTDAPVRVAAPSLTPAQP